MTQLKLSNPFNAPIYHEESVVSTMISARELSRKKEVPGTVICSDFQEEGRGRLGRKWHTDRGQSLMFTIFLAYEKLSSIPKALSLRTGLALSYALEDLFPKLAGKIKIKWPNDILLDAAKTAGILIETDGKNVFIGMGVNILQKSFPLDLKSKATSLILHLDKVNEETKLLLLEKILFFLHKELLDASVSWEKAMPLRLYKYKEEVIFAPMGPDSAYTVKGIISGIGRDGELLINREGKANAEAFFSGELRVYM